MAKIGYIAQHRHLDPPGSSELEGLDALVCNPSLEANRLVQAAPNCAAFFASFNAQMLASAGPDSEYFNGLRSAMSQFILRDVRGEPVLNTDFGDWFFDWRNEEGARAYALWIAGNSNLHVYLDDFVAKIPQRRLNMLPDPQLANFWPAWRSVLIRELRALLDDADEEAGDGGFTLIIANAGETLVDPLLNGVAREKAHKVKAGKLLTLARFAVQSTIGRKPTINVDWSGDWELPLIGVHRGVPLGQGDLD